MANFSEAGLELKLKNLKPFESGLDSIDEKVQSMNKGLILSEKIFSDLSRRAGQSTASFTKLNNRVTKAQTSFAKLEERLERNNELMLRGNRRSATLGDGFDLLDTRMSRLSGETRNLSAQFIESSFRLKTLNTQVSKSRLEGLTDDTRSFNKEIAQTPSKISRVSSKLGGLSGQVKNIGGTFSNFATGGLGLATKAVTAFGVATAGALGISIKLAKDNQSAFASLGKTIDGVSFVGADGLIQLTEQGQLLKDTFQDISQEIPITFGELSEFGSLGGQLGLLENLDADQYDEALSAFVKTVGGLSEATDLAGEDAAKGLARISGIFKSELEELGIGPGENIAKLGNVIVSLGNTMATQESEILNFATRLAGAGATAGLTQADIFALGASFSSMGLTAEAGATSVSKALLLMQEAIVGGEQGFIDNTATIEDYRAKLQKLNTDLVQVEAGQHGLGMSLVDQEKAFIEAGNKAEDYGRLLGDKTRAAAFETQKEILALQDEISSLQAMQGQPLQNVALEKFLDTVQKTEEGAKLTAESFQDLWANDAAKAFSLFVDGLALEGDNAAKVLDDLGLGSAEAQRTFLAMSQNSDLLTQALNRANTEFESGSALTDEVNQRYATLDSRIQIFKNTLSNTASNIGDVFLPAITKLVSGSADMVSIFGDRLPDVLGALAGKFTPLFTELTGSLDGLDFTTILDNGFDALILAIDGFDITPIQTAFGVLINDVFPVINSGITLIVDNWDVLSGTLLNVAAIGGAALAIGGLASAIAFLISPIGLAIAGAVALSAAWETNFLGIQETTTKFVEDFKTGGFTEAFEGIGIPESLIESGKSFIDGFIEPIKSVIPTIADSFSGLGESLSDFFESPAMQTLIGGAFEGGGGFTNWLSENADGIGEFVGVVVTTPLEQIAGFIDLISAFLDVLSEGASTESLVALKDAFVDLLALPFDNFIGIFAGEDFSVVESLETAFTSVSETVTTFSDEWLSGFDDIFSSVDLGVPTFDPALAHADLEATQTLWEGIFDNALSAIDMGIPKIGEGLTFATNLNEISQSVKMAFDGILTLVDLGMPTFPDLLARASEIVQAVKDKFTGLFSGIDLGLPELPAFITELDIIPDFGGKEEAKEAGEEVGKAQIDGIAKGIEDNQEEPKGAIERASDALAEKWANYWESESPSRLTERLGVDLMEGWALGLSDTTNVFSALDTFNEFLLTSFETLGQIVLQSTLPNLTLFKEELSFLYQTTIPAAASTTDDFTQVTLSELIFTFETLSAETIPAYVSVIVDSAIPATESFSEVTIKLTADLKNLGKEIKGVGGFLKDTLVPGLKLSIKQMDLSRSSAKNLAKIVNTLAKRYLSLAAAITAAREAGASGIGSPGGGPTPSFQTGGSFIVPGNFPENLKENGGMKIVVHPGELVQITPADQVSEQLSLPSSIAESASIQSPPISGATINNNSSSTDNSNSSGDTFVLNLPSSPDQQGSVINSFRLLETLARS